MVRDPPQPEKRLVFGYICLAAELHVCIIQPRADTAHMMGSGALSRFRKPHATEVPEHKYEQSDCLPSLVGCVFARRENERLSSIAPHMPTRLHNSAARCRVALRRLSVDRLGHYSL